MSCTRPVLVSLAFLLGCSAGTDARSGGVDPVGPADAGADSAGNGEICGNGFDDNRNAQIDEGCACAAGSTQQCFPGTPSQLTSGGICRAGSQNCLGQGEFTSWSSCTGAVMPAAEICGDSVDSDCDGRDCPPTDDGGGAGTRDGGDGGSGGLDGGFGGLDGGGGGGTDSGGGGTDSGGGGGTDSGGGGGTDSGGGGGTDAGPDIVESAFEWFAGDCITASCPADHPYPVGCEVFWPWWTDPRGCVAHAAGSPNVYFQAGDECDRGFVTGHLNCSRTPGPALNATNCPILKPNPMYVTNPSDCPDTD